MGTRSSIVVGRDNEQRLIREGLSAARAGQGGAIFLVGEGGIGKSRLAAVVADLAYDSGMRLMRGRSSTTGPLVPYRSLTEAVLSLLRAGEPIDLDALGPYRPLLGRLVPDLRPGTGNHGDASLVVLAEAVLRLMGVAGQENGCLLTLEDLHDADSETLGVTEYLVDNLAQQPALLLGTLRPEPCPALDLVRSVAQRGHGVLLELPRLGRPQVLQMVASFLDADVAMVPEAVVDLVWAGSTGNPFLVEDLLTGMCESEVLAQTATGWRIHEHALASRPDTFVRSVRRRVGQLSGSTRDLIMAGALFGSRFPLAVAQAVTGMADRELLTHLQGPLAAQLVVADDQTPDWYRFQHPMVQEALLTLLEPAELTRLARRTADAVVAVQPGLPGEWCQAAAALRLAAGDRAAAGRLFAEAGRRSLAEGAALSAATLLERAWELLADDDTTIRAETLEPLIYAMAEAGRIDQALAFVGIVEHVAGALDERRLARLQTRLAWAAMLAGELDEGLKRVEAARTLLGPDARPGDLAEVDVVAAHLELDRPGPGRLERVEAMARRAATVAEPLPLPVVACQAWQLLGALVRQRDPAEATACLDRSRAIAVAHGLPIWEIHALVRLGNDDALRAADPGRLEQARTKASRIGAVTARYQAEASLALQAILRCDFDQASALIDEVRTATSRLQLLETAEYVMLLRMVLAAHQGRRREMDEAFRHLEDAHGDQARNGPRVHGLARAVCALLEENRARARDEMARALAADARNPTTIQLIGRDGMHLLLVALQGRDEETERTLAGSLTPFRWDRQFALFARAVVAGRSGDGTAAAAAVAEAIQVGQPYPMGRHLGLRLAAEAALADGWGTPVDWLRAAEEHFYAADVSAVAGACRTLLRAAGARVSQRRTGFQQVPGALRSAGVTVREFEVLQLLVERLSNREIAERLYLSARTVERYISNLIVKTGLPNRIALSEFVTREYRS
ncbi:ATP-binding protein [Micromonospora carbonacea]|uniref:AAA family ATPase n=1 Tax=Micromonospora carbonacea TaxID=47853 RepID=A0A7H8XLK8_9ACTN|nr:AAA family ATPase [Micromonospora carbonacea]MBB5825960.1 ATP/maltotriose-dependent transcriptional regulator MalT [Micromonospora carbonacea]QLD25550.1 AAA family ATPase [Micromonospora carbonacea]